ncbi:MAG: ATP-grasp domain-containing protein [Bacteroidales bacterium]|nr:ATP-grasp domain-containing protein [Bacteroidales bacterium]
MLILEKPFVSETLVKTAVEKQIPVLRNPMSEDIFSKGHCLNLLNDSEFVNEYKKRGRIYTMSENALGWIFENIPDKELLEKITILKDKAGFRRICAGIYPDFFFKEVNTDELDRVATADFKFPIVLKPSVGFLSAGVYVIHDEKEWLSAVEDIKRTFHKVSSQFPDFVIGTHSFLVEEYIKGEEYAVDIYFDETGEPNILNIFHHRFASESDTSDRLYCSSRNLYDCYEEPFKNFLNQLNVVLKLRNFPMHIEFRYDGEKAVPIEINPLRFAGFCLNELQTHISGVHPIAAYLENIRLTKEEMWKGKEEDIYSFLVLERPADSKPTERFNERKFRGDMMDVLELRPLADPTAGVAATAFIRTDNSHLQELEHILHLNMHDYMTGA